MFSLLFIHRCKHSYKSTREQKDRLWIVEVKEITMAIQTTICDIFFLK